MQTTTHLIRLVHDHDSNTHKWFIDDRKVSLNYVPLEIDARQGQRDYQYLIEEGIIQENLDGSKFIQFTTPFESLRSVDGVNYELTQGNTRLKLLIDYVIPHNENLWESYRHNGDQGWNDFQTTRIFVRDFQLNELDVRPEDSEDVRLALLNRMRVTNDINKKHGVLNNLKQIDSEIKRLEDQAEELKKAGQPYPSKKEIRERVQRFFNINASRSYDATKLMSAPNWLLRAVENEILTPDVALYLISVCNKLHKTYKNADLDTNAVSLKKIYEQAYCDVQSEITTSEVPKITKNYVDRVYEFLLKEIQDYPDSPDLDEDSDNGLDDNSDENSDENSREESVEGSDDNSGEGSVDEYSVLESENPFDLANLVFDRFTGIINHIDEYDLVEDGVCNYSTQKMIQMIKLADKLISLFPKTIAEEERLKAEKDAEKERLKAEKDAEKARLKAEKEAEKARLKAEKEAEKARLKAEKEAGQPVEQSDEQPVEQSVEQPVEQSDEQPVEQSGEHLMGQVTEPPTE